MKRRRFFQALAAAPAAPALLAQQAAAPPAPSADPYPKIDAAVADAVADPVPHFFTTPQFAALRRLSDILMPAASGSSGALDAKAPEFLDFLIGDSPADRQQLYRTGLDLLNAQARKRFNKSFAETDPAQAAMLLAPLREPWTSDPPADPLSRFLHAAKQDVRTATLNSREYNTASGRRTGQGLYWYPAD